MPCLRRSIIVSGRGRPRASESHWNRDRGSRFNSRDPGERSSSYAAPSDPDCRAASSPLVAVVVVVVPRDDVEPSWTSRRRGWGLPHGVAARNDPAGVTLPRRACAMTLLRSPRIKRGPVSRRPLSLLFPPPPPRAHLAPLSFPALPPPGDDRREIGSAYEGTHTVRGPPSFVDSRGYPRLGTTMLSLLTDRTLLILNVDYCRLSRNSCLVSSYLGYARSDNFIISVLEICEMIEEDSNCIIDALMIVRVQMRFLYSNKVRRFLNWLRKRSSFSVCQIELM